MAHEKSNPITSIVIGTALLAGGIALFVYWGKPTLEKAQASKNWPTVSGVVKSSEVTVDHTRSGKKNKTMYSPEIAFAYEVDGRSYVSSKIGVSSNWSSSDSSSAYQITSKYPAGEAVEVAYDPADPSYAVLETGAGWATYFIYYLGPGLAVLGLLTVVGPLVKIAFAVFFFSSSSASSLKSQPVDSRFPESQSSGASPAYTGGSTTQTIGAPIDSSSTSDIGEGITIQ